MKTSTLFFVFLLALALLLGFVIWFKQQNASLTTGEVVCFEVAGTPEKARALLRDFNEDKIRHLRSSIDYDYIMIVLYALTLGLGCAWAARFSRKDRIQAQAKRVVGGVIAAGLADVIENLAMTYSIDQGPEMWSTRLAQVMAYLKFGLLAAALLFFLWAIAARWLFSKDQ